MVTKAFADLAGLGIECNQARINSGRDDAATTLGHCRLGVGNHCAWRALAGRSCGFVCIEIPHTTATLPAFVSRSFLDLRIKLPLLGTGDRIQCKHLVQRSTQVNRVIDLKGCALILGSVDGQVAGTKSPGYLEILDVRLVDLLELGKPLAMGITTIGRPVIAIGLPGIGNHHRRAAAFLRNHCRMWQEHAIAKASNAGNQCSTDRSQRCLAQKTAIAFK